MKAQVNFDSLGGGGTLVSHLEDDLGEYNKTTDSSGNITISESEKVVMVVMQYTVSSYNITCIANCDESGVLYNTGIKQSYTKWGSSKITQNGSTVTVPTSTSGAGTSVRIMYFTEE